MRAAKGEKMDSMKKYLVIGLVALVAVAVASRVPAVGSVVFNAAK